MLPLFTVIIPAKDRGIYLEHTLRTCMIQDYPNFEIIVSDDGSTDNTREVVDKAMGQDTRIRFFSHNPGLGMKGNFEFALNQVKPGYVIALGGDDGLLPDGIQKMYKILSETNTELLTWPCPHFIFPDYYNKYSKLVISRSKGVKIIKSKDFLNRVTKSLQYLEDIECPMFYIKGVVSTRLIDRVKSRTDDHCFYSCPTPDGYSGIVLAGEVEEYAFSGEPFSIGGDTIASQGRAYLKNDEKSKEEAAAFFKNSSIRPMHHELASQPYSPLITLMTADYLLTARDLPGMPSEFPIINYKNLIKKCFVELANRYSESGLIDRELRIIKKIAEKHGLLEFFEKLLSTSKLKIKKNQGFAGSVVTPRTIIFDSETLDLVNIFEAAQATKYVYNIYKNSNIKNIFSVFHTMIYTFMQVKKYKSEKFPELDDLN